MSVIPCVLLVCRFGSSGDASLAVLGVPFWHFWFCQLLGFGREIEFVKV